MWLITGSVGPSIWELYDWGGGGGLAEQSIAQCRQQGEEMELHDPK